MTRYNISLIPGDGIGPELMNSAMMLSESINDNTSIKLTLRKVDAGNYHSQFGKSLPDFTLETNKKNLCMPRPVGESAADVIIVLRIYFLIY